MANPFKTGAMALQRSKVINFIYDHLFKVPAYLFWLVQDTLGAWFDSRTEWRRFWLGLPVLIAAVGMAVLLAFTAYQKPANRVVRYHQEALKAVASKKFERASLCYRKLIQGGVMSPEILLEAADVAGKLGRQSEREGMLTLLTRDADSAYAPAHVLLAKELLGRGHGEAAEKELLQALETEPDNQEAHLLLGQIELARQAYTAAAAHLEKIAAPQPLVLAWMATAYREMGEESKARVAAQRAKLSFEQQQAKSASDPDARAQATVGLASIQSFLGNYELALAALGQERNRNSSPALREPVAGIMVAWADALGAEAKTHEDVSLEQGLPHLKRRLKLISTAYGLAPSNPEILRRFAILAGYYQAEDALTTAQLEALAAAGHEPLLVNVLMAAAAFHAGDAPKAKLHVGLMHGMTSASMNCLGQLAWLLVNDSKIDEKTGLLITNEALERAPENPVLLEVRGQLHAKLDQWEEAIADYEAGLKIIPERPSLHDALASSYDHLGNTKRAEQHRQKANTARETLQQTP